MNSSKFASVIYNSFPKLYSAISIRTKGFQNLVKFTKSSQVHVFKQKIGLSKKDINPLRRAIEPLWRAIEPLRRAIQPLWGAIQPLWRAIQPLWRAIQPRRKQNKLLRRNDEPLVGENESQQFTKPVVVHKQSNNSIIHLKRVCSSYTTCNSDLCVHEYRSSVRKFTKQPNVKRYRDREPSRIPFKKIILTMRKRKNRRSIKHLLTRCAPRSSILNKIATNYKECCFKFVHMQHVFIKSFGHFNSGGSSLRGAPGTNITWPINALPQKKTMHRKISEKFYNQNSTIYKQCFCKMFYKKGTFLAFAEAKSFASFEKSSERKMSDSILISDRALKRVCPIVLRETLFTRFSFENERSPVQLLTIMVRKYAKQFPHL